MRLLSLLSNAVSFSVIVHSHARKRHVCFLLFIKSSVAGNWCIASRIRRQSGRLVLRRLTTVQRGSRPLNVLTISGNDAYKSSTILLIFREQGAMVEIYFEELNYESLLESEAYGVSVS